MAIKVYSHICKAEFENMVFRKNILIKKR